MELVEEFTVPVPADRAWEVLTDVERIAPCLPGAQLEGRDGDEFRGTVKVKVGPITVRYAGTARFEERDEVARRAVVRATGRDARGQGSASATVTAQLHPAGEGTRVTVGIDLEVTGKVAQFGRGVLADVSARMLGQFVACLEQDLLAAPPGGAGGHGGAGAGGGDVAPPGPAAVPAPAGAGTEPAAPLRLVDLVGRERAQKVAAVAAVGVVAVALLVAWRWAMARPH